MTRRSTRGGQPRPCGPANTDVTDPVVAISEITLGDEGAENAARHGENNHATPDAEVGGRAT